MDKKHQRRSIRLRDYDYTSAGVYFVTICSHQKQCVFGRIRHDEMIQSAWGDVVEACWWQISVHFPFVGLDAFVIMPNHVHGIIEIMQDDIVATTQQVGATVVGATHGSPLQTRPTGPQRHSLGAIIGQFKSSVTRHIRRLTQQSDVLVWQRNYYEHIIRHQKSLDTIRAYIATNPEAWRNDSLFLDDTE